ncbi:hypothetical protein IAR50_004760 [Cryptococcus sp. DSM 104548]
MKLAYTLAALAGLTGLAMADDNSTLSSCQTSCVDSSLASNSTCGSTYTDCACDNTFVQAVKVCLYQDSCKSDVSTWFDIAETACEAGGGTANYSSTHSSNYTYSSAASSASATSDASSAATSAASTASSTSSSSGAFPAKQVGAGALAIIGAVVGSAMLL